MSRVRSEPCHVIRIHDTKLAYWLASWPIPAYFSPSPEFVIGFRFFHPETLLSVDWCCVTDGAPTQEKRRVPK